MLVIKFTLYTSQREQAMTCSKQAKNYWAITIDNILDQAITDIQ